MVCVEATEQNRRRRRRAAPRGCARSRRTDRRPCRRRTARSSPPAPSCPTRGRSARQKNPASARARCPSSRTRRPRRSTGGTSAPTVSDERQRGHADLDLRPRSSRPAASVAVQDGVDDARGLIAVFECGERGRTRIGRWLSRGDEAVDVAHHVAERVGPGFLVPARQVRIAAAPAARAATDP